jgi:hypothetical protein
MAAKHVIRVADLTIAQQDRAAKLVSSGKAGPVSALAWVALREEIPDLTLDHVKAMKSSEIRIIGEDEEDDEDDRPTSAP